jgi:hypothetical protein
VLLSYGEQRRGQAGADEGALQIADAALTAVLTGAP